MEGVLNKFKSIEYKYGKYGATAIFSIFLFFPLISCLVVLSYLLSETRIDLAYNLFVLVLGAIVGWAIGIFFSPYTSEDEKRFVAIRQAASAFISGYAISKFDRFLEANLFVSKLPQPDVWMRIGIFSASVILFAILIYSNRTYFRTDEPLGHKQYPKTLAIQSTEEKTGTGSKAQ